MIYIASLPISLILLWFMLKPKKDDPFPKRGLLRLIIAGILCTIISSFLTIVLSFILVAVSMGSENVLLIIDTIRTDPNNVISVLNGINTSNTFSPLRTLLMTFVTVGLVEELSKYTACRIAIRKDGMVRTMMDSVTCFAVVGLVFEIVENFLYAEQNGFITALMRNLAPVHFSMGVIMGWYFGKSLVTGEKKYRWAAVLVPAVIHTFYDTALKLMGEESVSAGAVDADVIFGMLGLLAFVFAIVLTVIVVVKIVKWRKNGTLEVPVNMP